MVGLAQDAHVVTVEFADGEAFRCDWVLGCDGASSAVRRSIGVNLVGETAAERFLLADVRAPLPAPRDFGSMWASEDGTLAAIPLPGTDQWRLMAPNPQDQPDDPSAEAIIHTFADLLRRRVGGSVTLNDVAWTSAFSIHRRLAAQYRKGRVILAGDAAHIHSPVGGQGMNTGLGDAENLAWKLALIESGRAHCGLLDSYEGERRPVAANVVHAVSGFDKLMLSTNPVVGAVRDHVLLPALGVPWVQRRIWRKASQLDITYRRGPLAQQPNWPRSGLRSGDRVPDLVASHHDGRPTRLHAELRGRWSLVAAEGTALGEFAVSVRERLGAERVTVLWSSSVAAGRALLVRPDGHLGWQGKLGSATVSRWLNTVLE